MSLAHARRAEQHHALFARDEAELVQGLDLVALNKLLKEKSKVSKALPPAGVRSASLPAGDDCCAA